MVDRTEFFKIADEILEEGQQPSQRAIRERLARGGSFSDLGPLYVQWATERGVRLRVTKDDLPQHLRDRLATVAAEIWCDGLRNGALTAQNERELLIKERDALRLALAETAARVDALEDGMKHTRGGTSSGDPVLPSKMGGDGDNFWNRVIQEIVDILKTGPLDRKAIFARLRAETNREAATRDGAWGPVRLARKVREKIRKDQLFLEPSEGLFCLREPDEQARLAGSEVAQSSPEAPPSIAPPPVRRSLRDLAKRTADPFDDEAA